MTLLLDRLVNQGANFEVFAVTAVIGFTRQAQEHIDCRLHVDRCAFDASHCPRCILGHLGLLQKFQRSFNDGYRRAQFVACGTREIAFTVDKRANALQGLLDGPCQQPDLVVVRTSSLDAPPIVVRQLFRVYAADRFGQAYYGIDGATADKGTQGDRQYGQHRENCDQANDPPHFFGRGSLYARNVGYDVQGSRRYAGGDYSDMQFITLELVVSVIGRVGRPIAQGCWQVDGLAIGLQIS